MTVARGESYNYARFRMANYELGAFPGPKAGEKISYDYIFTNLDGSEFRLADRREKWLVLESGSLTCPMYVKNVDKFAKLMRKYPDVEWLVIYVREAHPGSRILPAQDINGKLAYARRASSAYAEKRRIVVDSVEGKWHHDWGLMPNVLYIIDPEGTVVYRADWAFAKNVDRILQERDRIDTHEHIVILGTPPWVFVPVTLKAGWDALYDIVHELPRLMWSHLKADFASLRVKLSKGSDRQPAAGARITSPAGSVRSGRDA